MEITYNQIGTTYDTSRRADPKIAVQIAQQLQIASEGKYLDLACGTGNYTCALSRYGGSWYGCDISHTMLDQAKRKSAQINWSLQNVNTLNYVDACFDSISCVLAVHHFNNLPLAMSEIARVLKPGGRLVLFTSTPEQMHHYWLGHYFPQMMAKAAAQMPSMDALNTAAQPSGLTLSATQPFRVTNTLQDFFLYSGKYQPEIYLSPCVRQGISAFCNLCETDELERGLAQLRLDIESHQINQHLAAIDNRLGDYSFVTFEKIL